MREFFKKVKVILAARNSVYKYINKYQSKIKMSEKHGLKLIKSSEIENMYVIKMSNSCYAMGNR